MNYQQSVLTLQQKGLDMQHLINQSNQSDDMDDLFMPDKHTPEKNLKLKATALTT